ncbi:MAG: DinB family protein, partial [Acidobacteriota bacterium]
LAQGRLFSPEGEKALDFTVSRTSAAAAMFVRGSDVGGGWADQRRRPCRPRERDYNSQPALPALAALEASRARSILRLRAAHEEALERSGEFEGVGTVTLRRLLELWHEHDAGHIADMEALLRGTTGRTTVDAA